MELGYVSGVFGVTGEVRLHLHHRESDLLDAGRELVLALPDERRFLARVRARAGAGRRVIGRIEGVGDRSRAAELVGARLLLEAGALPALAAGEFYVRDVVGLPVHVGGDRVGRVVELHATAGGDVLEIDTADGPVFVPFIASFVREVDVAGGRVELAPDALAEP